MANRTNFQANPNKEICTLSTVNDLIYILQLMEVKIDPTKIKVPQALNKINLDMNDYIIMRKGIQPIWEDPKNCNGGTFTIKLSHQKGYQTWALFLMYMLGETMTYEMQNINGISVSFIADTTNMHVSGTSNNYTYIKIWDGKPNRTKEQFMNILPLDLANTIKNESLMYTPNKQKKHYNDANIINKFADRDRDRYYEGGFNNRSMRTVPKRRR